MTAKMMSVSYGQHKACLAGEDPERKALSMSMGRELL